VRSVAVRNLYGESLSDWQVDDSEGATWDSLTGSALPLPSLTGDASRQDKASRLLFERARAKRPALLAKRFAVIQANRLGARGRASDAVDRVHRASLLLLQGESLERAALAVGYHDTGTGRHAIKAGDSLTKAVRRLGFRVAFNQRDIDTGGDKGGLRFPVARWPLSLLPSEYGKLKRLAVRPSVPSDCVGVPLCIATFDREGKPGFAAVQALLPLGSQVQPIASASKAARQSNREQIRRRLHRVQSAQARRELRQARQAIRSIGGLSGDVNRKLSQQVCKLLNDSLGIPPDRVYLNFTDVGAGNWGWNGSTFG
jgi:hypothetical protein